MKRLLLFLSCLVSYYLQGQNLVQNPSFETLNLCPNEISQVGNAFSWTQTTGGTSDLYNQCANGITTPGGFILGVPNNTVGAQNAYSGVGYGGMILYDDLDNTYREYLQTQLTAPLIVGQTYCARFYVSLAGTSGYAANGLGALFTTNDMSADLTYGVFSSFSSALPFTPQFMSNQVITDTTTWIEIGGTFVATQPYTYVTIGGFLDETSQTVQAHASNITGIGTEFAYYYLDEIVVELVQPPGQLTITPSTPTVCLGQSVTLTATGNGGNTVNWSTSQTGNSITITPAATGTFTYTASAGTACSAFTGTIDIDVIDCPNGQLLLSVTEDTICQGETTTLTASGGTSYVWSNGATNVSTITVAPSVTTSYNVTGNVNGNTQTLGATIIVVPIQASVSYEELDNNIVDFTNTSTNDVGTPYWWFGDSTSSTDTDPVHTYPAPGTYNGYLVVQNAEGCIDTVYFTVNLGSKPNLYIPNSFTPNGDFTNETFAPKCDGCATLTMEIFNRWGQTIFTTTDVTTNPWNGTYKNEKCLADVYVYKVSALFTDGTERFYRGMVGLIR